MPAQYLATGKTSGQECSSTYEGRHVTLEESYLVHPTHGDGLVDKGDPVVCGSIVGVAFISAAAATDLVAIDTEGIWFLTATAVNSDGNSAIAPGDELFINKTTGVISKSSTPLTHIPFGYALGDLATGTTGVVAIKVHWDPLATPVLAEVTTQIMDHAAFTDSTGTSGYIDSTGAQLPAGAIPIGMKAVVTEGFAGDTTAVIQVGVSGDTDRFSSVTDQSVLDIGSVATGVPADAADGFAAAQTIRVTVTGGADWGNITAGKVQVTVYYIAA